MLATDFEKVHQKKVPIIHGESGHPLIILQLYLAFVCNNCKLFKSPLR